MIKLIETLPGFTAEEMIWGFADLRATDRIVVVTTSKTTAKQCLDRIGRLGATEAVLLPNRRASDARIVVGNRFDAVFKNCDFARRDYCFFPQAKMLLWKDIRFILQQAMNTARYPRLVGILTPSTTRQERRELLKLPNCEVISQRRVSFERIGGGPPVRGRTPLEIKRNGIWRHPVRNRRIARTARSLGDQALILVENNEHRRQLRRLLPNHQIITLREKSPPNRAIVVRCDGGVGELPNLVVDNWIRIFDFSDRHHPVLRKRSRQRRAIYQQKGWI